MAEAIVWEAILETSAKVSEILETLGEYRRKVYNAAPGVISDLPGNKGTVATLQDNLPRDGYVLITVARLGTLQRRIHLQVVRCLHHDSQRTTNPPTGVSYAQSLAAKLSDAFSMELVHSKPTRGEPDEAWFAYRYQRVVKERRAYPWPEMLADMGYDDTTSTKKMKTLMSYYSQYKQARDIEEEDIEDE
jgi:hypothetical protein